MKIFNLFVCFVIIATIQFKSIAQVGINANNAAPNGTAMLDVSSGNKGFLMPRMDFAARNGIITPATGLMLFNTSTNIFDFYNGSSWVSLGASSSNTLWNTSGTSIYNLNSSNVGIGLSTPTQAKLVVSGAVNGQVALFKSVSGLSIQGGNNPNIGFNMDDGKAIDTGNALKFGLSGIGFNMTYYASKTVGTLFSLPKNIFNFQDYTLSDSGYWLDLNNIPDSRLNVSDKMYSKSNGNLNLIPVGVIYYKVTDLQNGDDATKVAYNVGSTSSLLASSTYDYYTPLGDKGSNLTLFLNQSVISEYDKLFVVGSPGFQNVGGAGAIMSTVYVVGDEIHVFYITSSYGSTPYLEGTLFVYGLKN